MVRVKVILKSGISKFFRYKASALNCWYKEYCNDWKTVLELDKLFNKTFIEL